MKIPLRAFAALAVSMAAGLPAARAWTTVITQSDMPHECAAAALSGDASIATLDLCSKTLELADMSEEVRAKTLVNRAVVHMARNEWDACRSDLNAAQTFAPKVAEIYVNRGALLIHDKRYQAAIDEIDRGLALNTSEPEKAYYNRALAREQMDDIRGAYFDYRKAAELNPKWPDAKLALTRFDVRPAR